MNHLVDVEMLVDTPGNEITFIIRGHPKQQLTPQLILDAVSDAIMIEYAGIWGNNYNEYDDA